MARRFRGERKVLDSYSVEPSLLAQIIALAERLGWSKSEVIRESLRRFLETFDHELRGHPAEEGE